jgi:hypothetical protein
MSEQKQRKDTRGVRRIPEQSILYERVVPLALLAMGILLVLIILLAIGFLLGLIHV